MTNTNKSLGEQRVRTDFNTTGDSYIDALKSAGAAFINLVNDAPLPIDHTDNRLGEFKRLVALSLTDIESATQWAVKAFTINK